jgi:hypothetical protein
MRLRRATDRADPESDPASDPAAGSPPPAHRVPLMRRLFRFVLVLALLFVAASVIAVALYRILPPPAR